MTGARHHNETNPIDYEAVSVAGSVVTLTQAKVTNDVFEVFLVFAGGPIRMTLHGVDPAASFGIPLYDGEQFWLPYKAAKKARFIREGATNGTIHATYCDSR